MKKIVVLTGAGISAESGIRTFRDGDGLWRTHRFQDLATPEAWRRNPQLVLEFYNERRKQVIEASPNAAHYALVELEKKFDVHIITQNVDDLHERAGSSKVLHLHGEIRKARSTVDPAIIVEIKGWELRWGDLCPKGSQLRPHVVWFGEPVTEIENAARIVRSADLMIIIGTSLVVYPAAGLIYHTRPGIPVYVVDPGNPDFTPAPHITFIQKKATEGVPPLVEKLMNEEF